MSSASPIAPSWLAKSFLYWPSSLDAHGDCLWTNADAASPAGQCQRLASVSYEPSPKLPSDGLCQGSFYRPPILKALPYCSGMESKPVVPLSLCQRFTSKCYKSVVNLIPVLLNWRCPSTVSRFIAAVSIYPVDRMTLAWLWSHVGQESLKAIQPSLTNRYADCAVALEATVTGIEASVDHRSPGSIGRRRASGGMSVLDSPDAPGQAGISHGVLPHARVSGRLGVQPPAGHAFIAQGAP